MIKNHKLLDELERQETRSEHLSYQDALRLFEAMWQEAMALGAFPLKNPLEDIEVDIRLARILNLCSKSS